MAGFTIKKPASLQSGSSDFPKCTFGETVPTHENNNLSPLLCLQYFELCLEHDRESLNLSNDGSSGKHLVLPLLGTFLRQQSSSDACASGTLIILLNASLGSHLW